MTLPSGVIFYSKSLKILDINDLFFKYKYNA